MAGVRTLHITSKTDQSERDKAISKFKTPGTPYTAFITSMKLNAHGVDLHTDCHRGIALELPINASVAMQAAGRLRRLGQTKVPIFKFLYTQYSWDGATESRMLEKYALVLSAESSISPLLKGEQRSIVAFELMRRYFGHRESRYPRARVEWSKMDHPKIAFEGQFYSALGALLINNPLDGQYITRATLLAMAENWRPGTALTLGHATCEGRDPELKEGQSGTELGCFTVNDDLLDARASDARRAGEDDILETPVGSTAVAAPGHTRRLEVRPVTPSTKASQGHTRKAVSKRLVADSDESGSDINSGDESPSARPSARKRARHANLPTSSQAVTAWTARGNKW
jgi:hypothetical protein